MFGYVLDFCSMIVGAILPAYYTWKTLKSRRTTLLVPLAKYWTVFGALSVVESIANIFYLSYIIPGYSFIKFVIILYIYNNGYEHVFKNVISPFLRDYEPSGEKLLGAARNAGPTIAKTFVSYIISAALQSIKTNNGPFGQEYTSTNERVRIVEVEEEEQGDEDFEEEIIIEQARHNFAETPLNDINRSNYNPNLVESPPTPRKRGRPRRQQ